jgi:hypothetical protein
VELARKLNWRALIGGCLAATLLGAQSALAADTAPAAVDLLSSPFSSPSKLSVKLQEDRHSDGHQFESFVQAYSGLEREFGGKPKFQRLEVLDYDSWRADAPQAIDGLNAWYLVTDAAIDGLPDEELHVLPFSEKGKAKQTQRRLGGQVLSFNKAWGAVRDWTLDQRLARKRGFKAESAPSSAAEAEAPVAAESEAPRTEPDPQPRPQPKPAPPSGSSGACGT